MSIEPGILQSLAAWPEDAENMLSMPGRKGGRGGFTKNALLYCRAQLHGPEIGMPAIQDRAANRQGQIARLSLAH